MNIHEIYVLNRALDGKDIYAIPAFSKEKITKFLMEAAKKDLIQKGFLQDENTFTKKGVHYTQRIQDYKNACKYIAFDNLTVGVHAEATVGLIYNPTQANYFFERVGIASFAQQIIAAYPFLATGNAGDEKDEEVSFDALTRKYMLSAQNSVMLATRSEEAQETSEVLFRAGDRLYVYDKNTQKLTGRDAKQIHTWIEMRCSV